MPYIKQEDRVRLSLSGERPQTAGELNYLITIMLQRYLKEKGVSYTNFNDALKVLREITKYEDKK